MKRLVTAAAPIIDDLAAEGILAMKAGPKVWRFLPPLVIGWPVLAAVAEAVGRTLDSRRER